MQCILHHSNKKIKKNNQKNNQKKNNKFQQNYKIGGNDGVALPFWQQLFLQFVQTGVPMERVVEGNVVEERNAQSNFDLSLPSVIHNLI